MTGREYSSLPIMVDREKASLVAPFSPQLKFSGISELKLAPDRES